MQQCELLKQKKETQEKQGVSSFVSCQITDTCRMKISLVTQFVFFRPDMQYTCNSSHCDPLSHCRRTVMRGKSFSTARESLYFHILNPSAAGGDCAMLTVHASAFALMCFLAVTTGLAPSHVSQTLVTSQLLFCFTNHHEFQP